ncbi:MAG: glycosyl hydrolase family 18 protein [candidate division WOR-3 bacterium]
MEILLSLLTFESIHHAQMAEHEALPYIPPTRTIPLSGKHQVDRTVYGFYPYWMGTAYRSLDYDLLSHIAWFAVSVNSTGNIGTWNNWPGGWAELVDSAHAHGIRLHMTATCFDPDVIRSIITSYKAYCSHVLVEAALSGGADGINIDFEFPYSSDSLLFLDFIRILSDSCRARGLELCLCVGAVNWNGRFLVDRLAPLLDGIFIMGYGYFWSGSPTTGPVSPLTGYTYNVTNSITYYVNYAGGPEKIIIGLPYYGYKWKANGPDPGDSTLATGTAMTYANAADESETYGLLWHSYSQTPWYRYYTTAWYQTWFDNDSSLDLKYDLAIERGLQGVGIWALGYDGDRPELWEELEEHFFVARINARVGPDSCLITCSVDPSDSVVWQGKVGPGPSEVTVRRRATYDIAFQSSPRYNSAFAENIAVRRDTAIGEITLSARDTEYVIDDLDPECFFSGAWRPSEYISGYWGLGYRWAKGGAPASVLFIPEAITHGVYRVFLRYTSAPNRAEDVPVRVQYAGGDTVITVDQTSGGGDWFYLGEFELAPGSYVQVSNAFSDTTKVVIADAVCFSRAGAGTVDAGEEAPFSAAYDPKTRALLAQSPLPAALSLYDVSGRLIRQEGFSGKLVLGMGDLPKGIYFAWMRAHHPERSLVLKCLVR